MMRLLVGMLTLASVLAARPLPAGPAAPVAPAAPATPSASAAPTVPPGPLAPSGAVSGWDLKPEPRTFVPAKLYEYIDGAADLFLGYGVVSLIAGEYQPTGDQQHAITVDVYDMGTPLHAFGVFASERPEEGAKALEVGAQSYADASLIAFWQGRYYVKVSQASEKDTEAAVALAKATSARLPHATAMPPELHRLPEEGRIPGSEHYYRTSALGHKFLVETVSAVYRHGKTTTEVYVADLATLEKAEEGLTKLRAFESDSGKDLREVPGLGESAFAVRDPSSGEMVAVRHGRYLVIAMSTSASRAVVTRFVAPAVKKLEGSAGPTPGAL